MQAIEHIPAIGRLNGKALREVFSRLVELADDMLDRVGENSQLLEEPRKVGKQDMVQKPVPLSGILRCVAAEKLSVQRFD
jgi:hypothetical protein